MQWFDPANPVMALCAEGMQVDGEPARALSLFEQAWSMRTDDFDAAIAAHFVARHQPTPALTHQWNARALQHADALQDQRAAPLVPSLCLNLADSCLTIGLVEQASKIAERGIAALAPLPVDGYVEFVRGGLTRLQKRIEVARRA